MMSCLGGGGVMQLVHGQQLTTTLLCLDVDMIDDENISADARLILR